MTMQSPIYADESVYKEQITKNLEIMKNFSKEEFNLKKNRDYIIKKLGLLENPYWKNIQKLILKKLKENSFVIVKGLPFDENNRLFVSLISCLGEPIKHNSRVPYFVRELSPRDGPKPFENFPHTDSPHWPIQNDLTSLQCIRRDYGGGGFSRIVPLNNLLEELKNQGFEDIIQEFQEGKFPFLLDRDFGDEGKHFQPILYREKYNGHFVNMLRFCKVDTLQCIEKFQIDISKDTLNDFNQFEKIAGELGKKTQFLVEEGELLIFDNKRALHSKTTASPNSDRLLKKIKSNIDRKKIF